MRAPGRIAAAVIPALMIHAMIASGAMRCTPELRVHGAHAAAASAAEHSMHEADAPMHAQRGESAPARPHSSHNDSHCANECTPANCGAAGHCSGASLRSASYSPPQLAVRREVIRAGDDLARWLIAAPEPPPPKA